MAMKKRKEKKTKTEDLNAKKYEPMAKEKLSQRVLLEILIEEIEKLREANGQTDQSISTIKRYLEEIKEHADTIENTRKKIENMQINVNTEPINQTFNQKISELKDKLSESAVFPVWGTVAFFMVLLYAVFTTLMVLGII